MLPHILPLLPPHDVWVEAFCESAVVTLAKDRSSCEVINDRDDGVAGFYRILRDPEQARELRALLDLTPYSRAEYLACRRTWRTCADPVERARRWFVVARQSFAGKVGWGGWAYSAASCRAMAVASSKWLGAIEGLPSVHARLQGVQIECHDWRRLLASWDRPNVLLYADPPYAWSTRRGGRGYTHELTDADHGELVSRLRAFRVQVVVSGYACPLYEPLERAGWHRRDIATSSHAAGRTVASGLRGVGVAKRLQARVKTLWWNYDHAALVGQRTLFDLAVG